MRVVRYVLCVLMFAASIPAFASDTKYVSVENANIRNSPSGTVIDRLSRGAEVTVHASSGEWARVSPDEASPRWVHSTLLCSSPRCWSSATHSSARSASRAAGSGKQAPSRGSGSPVKARTNPSSGGSCPCSGNRVCVGPRGGRYCITSGGNKRYGV